MPADPSTESLVVHLYGAFVASTAGSNYHCRPYIWRADGRTAYGRIDKALHAAGFIEPTKVGREDAWRLTPAGEAAIREYHDGR